MTIPGANPGIYGAHMVALARKIIVKRQAFLGGNLTYRLWHAWHKNASKMLISMRCPGFSP
ncbi:hypothetical protein KSX_21490 [Ktedonospora formicarum]|uniref:Uncharacterized protein n=1 Tax=Ktedonospora formicarum TaxID=2778364 RepID=A0A8J3HVH6_9CHLR|nr:hypothetical protein KSX_21490 [Ktedonospora formicarum]